MSHSMKVQSFPVLLKWILKEYQEKQSIFGIHRSLFYTPKADAPYAVQDLFGHYLATPLGPAAGPHTQLTQNILCSWLSGARFIELKTVQCMDELEIARPCIDMEDEGYNVEWSQELKLEQSAPEYIKAWALIHILPRILGWDAALPVGTIFNMSVGYNLEGVKTPEMTRFMDRMQNASAELAEIKAFLQKAYPQFAEIEIPDQITNSVTLSTMHGCPPDEIGRIARFLIEERGLHTTVKLNPTLLGRETVLGILHDELGYHSIDIPEKVFDHDLKYDKAVELVTMLWQVAKERGLAFGVKLSNTLAMANYKKQMPGEEMYMSGRALYPVTMQLVKKFAQQFGGKLSVSYSAGADALNLSTILATGALPVTVASDLLKPGGYSNLVQYLEQLETDMKAKAAQNLGQLAADRLANVERAAEEALRDIRYKKAYHDHGLPKLESELSAFDCVVAPCTVQCAVCQDVPRYAWQIAEGDYDAALTTILERNPLPSVTGYVCTHLCQSKCTRNNYDEPVAIRSLKRFASEHGKAQLPKGKANGHKAAVVGSGPSGLAAATALALRGVDVTVFEKRERAGGMMAIAPAFRVPKEVLDRDVQRIRDLGVEIRLSQPVNGKAEELLQQGYDAVYLACGFPQDAKMDIPGDGGEGVYSALELLEKVARGEKVALGKKAVIIGGGNTAMDAARTAQRLTGQPVTVVYRRTRQEMPAIEEEIHELFAEGNRLEELATPEAILLEGGRVKGLSCSRNKLGEPDASGRRRPVPIPDSAFTIETDAVIIAIGQSADLSFFDGSEVRLEKSGGVAVEKGSGKTSVCGVYAGGDAVTGPAIVIQACADGQRAAAAICEKLDLKSLEAEESVTLSEEEILRVKQARCRKSAQKRQATLPFGERNGFELVDRTLAEAEAKEEAKRCLQCASFCDKCVEVCPNRANFTYQLPQIEVELPRLSCLNGKLTLSGTEEFAIRQTRQILHLDDFCNECGNCASFCVHQGRPYLDKPRLFREEADFAQEKDNAFYIAGERIKRREGGREMTLALTKNGWLFEDDALQLTLSDSFELKAMQLKTAFSGDYSLRQAAEMAALYYGVTRSLPFLLTRA